MTGDVNPVLVLSPDVILKSIGESRPEGERRQQVPEGEGIVSRRHGRISAATLSADAVQLLRAFEEPRSIVDAIGDLAGEDGALAQQILREALPLLQTWIDKGILIDPETAEMGPLFEPGDAGENFVVLRTVQRMDDTEVYQVRTTEGSLAALKVQRAATVGSLDREADILKQGPPSVLPKLLQRGNVDGCAYVLLGWVRGRESGQVAAALRSQKDRRGLLDLCRGVAKAYAQLHESGFLHGDVHPRNILVEHDGTVRLIDLGLACPIDASWTPQQGRPGVPFYYEPEHARSVLAGKGPRPVSAAGEQFAVCVLLYHLATGTHYADFDLYRDTLYQRIAEASPRSFEENGSSPWPQLEDVFRVGLASQPEDRFPSMSALAEALARLPGPSLNPSPTLRSGQDALDNLLRKASLGGPWWTDGLGVSPTATVKFGAAGIALALQRIAGTRGDGETLALADVWAQRALKDISTHAGLYNDELNIDRPKTGTTTPFHTASGVASVQAFGAKSRGDTVGLWRAVRAFIDACNPEETERDLTLGRCGSLLHCALLRDVLTDWGLSADAAPSVLADLDILGDRLDADLWRELSALPDLNPSGSENLGVAHGWAGYLYASLQWVRASDGKVSSFLVDRLDQLARLGYLEGRGRRWGWRLGDGWTSGAGWCNGSAGFVFLWSLAARLTGETTYRDFAIDAAWTAWESGGPISSLCCGLAGQAYALLNVAKHSGDTVWLERARVLASRARPDDTPFPHSLYKGETGLAVLQADLECPEEAAMPFFEEDAVDVGWD